MKLITNRYNQVTPTGITSNGLSISTPIYINLTTEQGKQLLNAFRTVVANQRRELGYEDKPKSVGQLSVETKTTPPLTQAEKDIGMTEESLRYALFARQGTPERLVLKLCSITGVFFTTRQEIEEVFGLWLDTFFDTNDKSTAKTTSKTSKAKAKRSPKSSTTPELVPNSKS